MKQIPPTASLAEIQAQIRSSGLRSTAPRIAVLRHMKSATTPVSHAELFDALADQGFDRATIYRNLMDLTDAGLLSRTDVGDHVWRFELHQAGQPGHEAKHPHFMCTDCGEVACLPGVNVRISPAPGAPRALSTKDLVIQVQGQCDRCAA